MNQPFAFACPVCRSPLVQNNQAQLECPIDHYKFAQIDGIWCFLTQEAQARLYLFMEQYRLVRQAEKRGSAGSDYYRSLPFKDLTGQFTSDWKVRSQSYRALLRSVIAPLEKQKSRALKILDLGAGNGWLSYRLGQRGHSLAAVDLQTNALDGLGAHVHYDAGFLPLQADFDHLPLCPQQIDLVIYNASFHYSTGYTISLKEAIRVLHPDGQVVVLDSPIYQDAHSGAAMVKEREEQYRRKFGFASNTLPSENYLTFARLQQLGQETGLQWRLVSAFYGLSWALRPLRARLSGRREPAQFRIAAGQLQAQRGDR